MKDTQPQWMRMMFKGNKVWMAVDVQGNPLIENGKVLIKYQKKQDYQYWVWKDGVEPIDPSKRHQKQVRKTKEKKRLETPPPPEANAIVIHTDGASSGNPGPAGIGAVMRFGSHQKEISQYIGIATNNIAELMAIRKALSQVKNPEMPTRLYTDSQYAYGVLVLGWQARKNQDLIRSIQNKIKAFSDLKLFKIPGHSDIPENERADRLARMAITEEKRRMEKKE